ncbi:leucine-rich repeat-containing G-protein coupled receptor 4 [Anopheles moucheti]|uniref:leucine-rich repeat-containing G-protein coupled receptor 4 n=1 Tax=Anopheles moucheti TaxID=186751 RepID=UPI0022F068FC|nr:leucine-rich repeat-containing G-protein coupled receptor 4 [Anopheles moucheti]
MRRRLIWDYLVPMVLLLTILLWTSTSEVHAKNEEDAASDGENIYDDEYDDTYDDDGDISGPLPVGTDQARHEGGDSDKSRVSSSTTLPSGATKATSTTGSPSLVIFGDADDHSTEQEEYACPGGCSCFEGIKYINCSHRALTDIPSIMPGVVVRLDLSHNNLKRLNVEAFQNITDLQELLLAGNAIEQFDKELLLKLDKLEMLDLSSNQLSNLDSDCFSEASKSLRRVYLNDNPIVLPDGDPFLELPELEQLHLVNCNLTELPDEAFKELGGLELLDLFGNQFDEDMSVDMFEPLKNLLHLRLPSLSESTVRELCEKLERIDVIDITTHNISCFYLTSESSFEESIIVDVPKTPEPIFVPKEPTTPRPTRKALKNLNDIMQDYKSSTARLESSDLALQPTTSATNPKGGSISSPQSGSPSSASITHPGNLPAVEDGEVIKKASTGSEHRTDGEQSLLASITPETMKQLLMAIIGVTVLGLIIGLICRRTGIKNKLCGTKRRPAPTDQVRPAEEVPLNKV